MSARMHGILPPLAITMGDAAGIGPEIVARFLNARPEAAALVIGDIGRMRLAQKIIGGSLEIVEVFSPRPRGPGEIPVLQAGSLPADLQFGAISAAAGAAAHAAILRGIDLSLAGDVAGIVTAPIHKEALHAAGVCHPGHTEILAERTGAKHVAMMLADAALRVVLVSIHVSLRQALALVTLENVSRTIDLAAEGARALGIAHPRIAVAGLNPHAGEGGLFGDEDRDIIAPAVLAKRAEGLEVSGPYPPDTVFMRARKGEFDIVVAQYHDQGLIPIKLMGLDKGVNVTLGLPIIRTSVDHGTAFDIAGKGVADASSLAEAFDLAENMARARLRG